MRVEDRNIEELNREQEIFDRGYEAVRTMAKEMVANGATLADVLYHADQVWHEFKIGAMGMNGVIATGMYLDNCDRELTHEVILSYDRYARGVDEIRVAMYVKDYSREAAGENSAA
ncbi:MAG TPA: hypothetical protein VK709_13450 [Candidatus Saccharimonadales bacterium]|jgi:hypothetical protein|nr:hypothetical protein [Candidatus Saccharimonadales bacterium]